MYNDGVNTTQKATEYNALRQLDKQFSCQFLFLGGLFPPGIEQTVIRNSKHNVQNAANRLQWSFVEGLDCNLTEPVSIINSMYIASFPHGYRKLMIPTYPFAHSKGVSDINVGFVNLPLYKHLSRERRLRKHIKHWIKNVGGKQKVMIAYAATSVMVKSLLYAKQIDPSIVTCLIMPDLPEFMHPGKSGILYNRFKALTLLRLYARMQKIDCHVFLTEGMAERTKFGKPYTIVEGIFRENSNVRDLTKYDESKRVFLYTGGIEKAYGVIDLVKAFHRVQDDRIQLLLCGSGDAEKGVLEYCRLDPRINYLGLLPQSEVLKLQADAHYLINPRNNNEDFARYSFPSKTMEYLASGTIVLSYMLSGIPSEYTPYLYIIKDEPDGLFNAIQGCLRLSSQGMRELASDGLSFVKHKKNPEEQAAKVLKLIENLVEGERDRKC